MQQRGRFLTGSIMGHVVRMTLTGATGITFVFLVDLANLFWLSQLGDPALVAAIGYAFAVQFFSVSTGIGLMIAATVMVSTRIGKGQREGARREATSAMIMTIGFQTLVAALIVGFRHDLLALVGAEGKTAELAARYLAFTVPSLIVMAIGLIGSAVLRAEGDGKRAMYVTLTSGTISMAVDPFLIIYLGLGLDGAAYALILSRFVLAGMALRFVIGTHNLLALPRLRTFKRVWKPFFFIAFPAMLTQISTPFGNYLLTGVIAGFGDDAVAAWAVVSRLTVVAFGGIFSLSGAIGGIYGQNFGAQQYDRLRQTFKDSLIFCAAYTTVAWILLSLSANWMIGVFGLSTEGAAVYKAFAYIGSGAFVLVGALFVSNATFNSLGKPTRSTLSNWARDGVFMLPAAWLGAAWFAAPGVVYAQAVAGGIAGALAAMWSWHFLKSIGQNR